MGKKTGLIVMIVLCSAFRPGREVVFSSGLNSFSDDGPPVKASLTLSFVGDIMAHNVNYNIASFDDIYRRVGGILRNDDFSFANLEFPVNSDKDYSTYPRFNVKSDYVLAAVRGGLDVFSLSNNHATDQGGKAVLLTAGEMDKIPGIVYSGIRKKPSGGMIPELIEKDGWRIGFLAVTALLNQREGKEYIYLVNYKNPVSRQEFLHYIECAVRYYDFFILSVHAGKEYSLLADEKKMGFFRDLADAGVDILWGHHPHVLQTPEFRITERGRSLILPSCGNFISGQPWNVDPANPTARANTGDSAIFRVDVEKRGAFVNIKSLDSLPISHYKHPTRGMITDYTCNLSLSPEIPEVWRTFYKERLVAIRGALNAESLDRS